MQDRLRFFLNRLKERLWVRPLVMTIVSVALVFLAGVADKTGIGAYVPDISPDSINTLLTLISASMLVIATFSVASMVSAYASAGSTATPRSFTLVLADDVSQNALSAFISAFIFSVVGLIAVENSYYDKAGRFTLFCVTALFFVIVIITFVRWVDSIARLGRLGTTIDKVEEAASTALERRRRAPTLRGVAVGTFPQGGAIVYATEIGYVQRIDLGLLQAYAETAKVQITIEALPGTFTAPGQGLVRVVGEGQAPPEVKEESIRLAFEIGKGRTFDEDPRFGLVVLSEIASRALSPAVNDPGTAIDVIGRLVRLLAAWTAPRSEADGPDQAYDRVAVPRLALDDLFDDAFNAAARDGAGTIEVVVRLQKALASLAATGDTEMRAVAARHARRALARAEQALDFPEDLALARAAAAWVT